MELKSFRVEKLHGVYDFELKFQNNTLILVGENGSGKSTLMKMLFYVLSCQWSKLAQYKFEKTTISIGQHDDIKIKRSDLDLPQKNHIFDQLPQHIKNLVLQEENLSIIEMECSRYGFPFQYVLQIMNRIHRDSNTLKKISEQIREVTKGVHILYLPTYRRIEQDLSVVLASRLDNIDKEFLQRSARNRRLVSNCTYSEIIEFGMEDVDFLTNNIQNKLKDKWSSIQTEIIFSFLNDAFSNNITKIDNFDSRAFDPQTINKILGRVDIKYLPDISRILSVWKNANFGNIKEEDKVIFYYLMKVLKSLNKFDYEEEDISSFAKVCNKYLFNKAIDYNQIDFSLTIKSFPPKYDNTLKWDYLSSGEKQIVSLFCHMYLDESNKYFVLIDEPELSLSIRWQKMFLDDLKNAPFCEGLFAVTHSPFIFENDLDMYAHGINEFKFEKE